jgi:hypothetical protein
MFASLAQQSGAKEPLAIPKLSSPPKIDGLLDNSVWEKEALKIENFVQLSPKENGAPSQKTTAYLGYDAKNLYLAFRCEDTEVKKLRCSVTNRDNCLDDDWIMIFLDAFNEKRRAFTFAVNPIGIQMDFIRTESGGNDNMDASWDTVFESDGKIDDKGYTVEMAIPFKSIRFPDKEDKVWGLTIGRNIPRAGEVIIWPEFSRNIPGLLSQAREILIRGKVEKGKNLEIMPVATSLKREGEKVDFEPGVNVKYGVSSDLTLDFALNPDFSHIEADAPQIDVNLRYALRYPEKRPFFLEGMEIFQFPEIEMVYTRRIIDPLFGAKISGKLGRFAYGVLSTYDEHPTESLWEVHGGGGSTDNKALFNIVRLKTDVFKESYMGFSLADKEIDGSHNRVAGFDGQFKFNNKFFFTFQALASQTKYPNEETGFSPALYAEFFYFTKNWSIGSYWKSIHPDFEASSGFVNRTDYRTAGVWTSATIYPDKKYLNQINFNFQVGQRDAYFSNTVQDKWARFSTQFRFTEFNRLWVTYENAMERYADIDFKRNNLEIQAESNIIKWLPFTFTFLIGDMINYDTEDTFLGWGTTYGISANFKPNKRLQLGLDFSKNTFWKKRGGDELWDYNVVRARTTYQLSKSLSVRAIVDYNHFYKQIFGSLLLSYVLRPGTVFFIGYDSNYDRNEFRRYDRRNYNVFLKFSYWWRV